MKSIVLGVFLSVISMGNLFYSQYTYQIQIEPNNTPKLNLSKLTEGISFTSRHIKDSIFSIKSFQDLSIQDFESIASNQSFSIMYFEKIDGPIGATLSNSFEKACCNITIEMYDSYGDGWNGGELEVTIDGVTTTHSVSAGSGSETDIVSYCDGQTLSISYSSGSWEGENTYSIYTSNTLINDGPSPSTGNVYSSSSACSPTAQDCEGAQMVCNNNSFSGNSSGSGTFDELDGPNDGCLSGENQSSWYYVNIGTGGTLEMTIDPVAADDYDFAIWGPFDETTANANCPPISSPIRCSWALDDEETGMRSNNLLDCGWFGSDCDPNTEDDYGNGWVAPLNTSAGDIYILLIDNYSASNDPFDLNWGGSAGLDCTTVPLPVELISFEGQNQGGKNVISWTTASEKNNDYFTLQHSTNGVDWSNIEDIPGAGTTSEMQFYSTTHRDFEAKINYYRLSQVDFNGDVTKHKVISIDNSSDRKLLKRVNTLGQEVSSNYKGIVILYFNDGSIVKIMQ